MLKKWRPEPVSASAEVASQTSAAPGLQLASLDPKTLISMVGKGAFVPEKKLGKVTQAAFVNIMLVNREACVASGFAFLEVDHVNVATQTVGFYPPERMADYRDRLASAGAQRITPLGDSGPATIGAPDDAMYPLHRFVHWMVHERGVSRADA